MINFSINYQVNFSMQELWSIPLHTLSNKVKSILPDFSDVFVETFLNIDLFRKLNVNILILQPAFLTRMGLLLLEHLLLRVHVLKNERTFYILNILVYRKFSPWERTPYWFLVEIITMHLSILLRFIAFVRPQPIAVRRGERP